MEGDTLKTLVDLLASGGNAALIFLVWIGFQAVSSAKEASKHLKEVRDATLASAPKIDRIDESTRDMDKRTDRMDTAVSAQGMKLDALLARSRNT